MMCKTYHCRASELYGISHPVQAFFFDRAVYTFGTSLENDLKESTRKAKKQDQADRIRDRVIAKWLGPTTPGVYRDPHAERKGW
jgi:hypothetical protein